MNNKILIKRLTASDLTLFKWHFENINAGNQKAINLNRDIFIDILYPSLPIVAEEEGWRFPLDLYLFGPGLHKEYNLQRKIIKGGTYKNWRLDGEFISVVEELSEVMNEELPNGVPRFNKQAKKQMTDDEIFENILRTKGNRNAVGTNRNKFRGTALPHEHGVHHRTCNVERHGVELNVLADGGEQCGLGRDDDGFDTGIVRSSGIDRVVVIAASSDPGHGDQHHGENHIAAQCHRVTPVEKGRRCAPGIRPALVSFGKPVGRDNPGTELP